MNTVTKEAIPTCFDIRGKDTETYLVGPITSQIIDADRLVRVEWQNGFPNWMLYRTVLAGDSLYLPKLKHWVIAFTWVYAINGGVKRQAITEELIGAAALDALCMILYKRELQPYALSAKAVGASRNTYLRLRDRIYLRLKASLDEYWLRLVMAHAQVQLVERKLK